MKYLAIFWMVMLISCAIFGQTTNDYLNSILDSINEIKSATYDSERTSSAPHDTVTFRTIQSHVQMYVNPSDTLMGASFSTLNIEWADLHYDGKYAVRLNQESRTAEIDTLAYDTLPKYVAPIFVSTKSLVKYALANAEGSQIRFENYQDSVKISFHFPGRIVEFMNLIPFEHKVPDRDSRYVLWIDPATNLPFRYIRKMQYHHSSERCSNLVLNDRNGWEFQALLQIPPDYKIKGTPKRDLSVLELEGKPAPTWKLKEIAGDSVSLEDVNSKVVLLKFTGVGCGPFHASLPFLKELNSDLGSDNFEIVSIETWSKNLTGLQRYKDKNGIAYKFLVGDEKLKRNYQIQGVPVFFLLNEDRVIKKVILGYQKETERVIESTIKELF